MIFGGTGFLGQALAKKLLQTDDVCVFSRSEDKHRKIRLDNPKIESIIGDVRDHTACLNAILSYKPDVIIAAQALKQIDLCEQMPFETVQTNIIGTKNLCEAVKAYAFFNNKKVKFLAISTDKSASPSTLYGATKLIQERLHLSVNHPLIINNAVRYGNVLSSTGSIIPVFREKLLNNENVYLMNKNMTRFLLTIDDAIQLILDALKAEDSGKIFIPKAKSCKIVDLAEILIEFYGDIDINGNPISKLIETEIRPLEKIHEIFFSQEEISRIQKLENKFILHPINSKANLKHAHKEFSSGDEENIMTKEELNQFLQISGILS